MSALRLTSCGCRGRSPVLHRRRTDACENLCANHAPQSANTSSPESPWQHSGAHRNLIVTTPRTVSAGRTEGGYRPYATDEQGRIGRFSADRMHWSYCHGLPALSRRGGQGGVVDRDLNFGDGRSGGVMRADSRCPACMVRPMPFSIDRVVPWGTAPDRLPGDVRPRRGLIWTRRPAAHRATTRVAPTGRAVGARAYRRVDRSDLCRSAGCSADRMQRCIGRGLPWGAR